MRAGTRRELKLLGGLVDVRLMGSSAAASARVAALPGCPSAHERLLYVRASNRLLSVAQLISWAGLSLALLLFSLNSLWLLPFTAWVLLGVGYFGLSFLANTTFRRFDLDRHDEQVGAYRRVAQPSVDVFLPNCGEELRVLANAFRYVAALEHLGELRVYCLDDAGRPEVEQLARRHGFSYLSRPDKGRFKKAGNLRYAYLCSQGEFIAVFDADFCPRPDFLAELLPYAAADPSVGIVQSPQYFAVDRDRNWLENGAGSVQEFFYRWVMPGRDARRSPICVGTNAIYRRSALEQTDGGALVENSEDVHTGFDLMAKGWRTKYVPVLLAKGLCPHTLATFFNQQHRWCSGSMSLLFSRKFWSARIGLRRRLTFLSGMTYFLYTGLAVFFAPLPAALMVWLFADKVFWWNYALLVPALLQNFLLLPRWHRSPYGLDAMRTKIVYAWAHLFAFRDRLFGRPLAWSASGANGPGRAAGRLRRLKLLIVGWPAAVFAATTAGSLAHMDSALDLNYWPPLLSAAVFAFAAATVLRPLAATTYRTPLEIETAGSRTIPTPHTGSVGPVPASPVFLHSTMLDEAQRNKPNTGPD